jgi:hypothetical protein
MSPDTRPLTITDAIKLAHAIRSFLRRWLSAQGYNESLETSEGEGDNPVVVKRGRMRWFG